MEPIYTMSAEYAAALEKSRAATRAFRAVQDAYRARTIGDAEYMAGRRAHEAAMAEFDVAMDNEAAEAANAEADYREACRSEPAD